MSAKKLRHPPKLEPDFKLGPRPKRDDFSDDDLSIESAKSAKRRRTWKPRIAAYLLIVIIFMVAFEILIVVGAGENYRYIIIQGSKNDLGGKILNDNTTDVITAEEINISMSNYVREIDYFFSTVDFKNHIYNATINYSSGEYKFSDVYCGRYIINVSIKGYITEHRKVLIVPSVANPGKEENREDFYMVKNTTSNAAIITTGDFESESLNDYYNITVSCFTMSGVFIIISLVGIIHCLRYKKYKIALVGAIFGMLAGLFTIYLIGAMLGVFAVILIVFSKEEFQS